MAGLLEEETWPMPQRMSRILLDREGEKAHSRLKIRFDERHEFGSTRSIWKKVSRTIWLAEFMKISR